MFVRRVPTKRQIRRITEHLLTTYNNNKISVFSGLSKQQKKNLWVKILWVVAIVICFSTCVYQIVNLVNYYRSVPVRVHVTSEIIENGDMPLATFCTDDTEDFNKLSPDGSIVGFNATDVWNARNTTTTIKEAYFATMKKRHSNATLESILTIPGICTNIYTDKLLPIGDSTLRLHVEFNKNLSSLLQFVGDKGRKVINTLSWREVPLKSLQRISIVVEKYIFLNRKNHSCSSIEDFQICQSEFENRLLASKNLLGKTCRLPYMNETDKTICNITTHIALIYKFNRDNFIYNSLRVSLSRCPRQCVQSIFYLHGDYNIEPQLEMQLLMHSNVFRIMQEQYIYDLTSLLCDIGGNLCLYLGLSCMAAANIVTKCIWQLITRRRRSSVFLQQPLTNKIGQCLRYELLHRTARSTRKSVRSVKYKLLKLLSTLVKIFLVGFSVCIVYLRTSYYLTYPTSNTADLVKQLGHPSIYSVVCSPTENIQPVLNDFAETYQIPIDDIEFVDLLLRPLNISNFDVLWTDSSNIDFFPNRFNRSPNVTMFGNCTFMAYYKRIFKSVTSKCKYRVFYILKDDVFNLKHYFIFYCNHINIIRYKKQKVVRLNTPVSPCVSIEKSIDCDQNCYKTMLLKKNTSCSLPFTPFLNLPLCNSWKSASETLRDYLEAFFTTNPLKDCSCSPRCDETVLLMKETTHYLDKEKSSYYFEQSNIYWEVITQNLSYSVINLLCDIGSNLGSIIGVSLLSTFHIVPTILSGVVVVKHRLMYSLSSGQLFSM